MEGRQINHLVCIALDERGYFVYDDLLNLPPHGYQVTQKKVKHALYITNMQQ